MPTPLVHIFLLSSLLPSILPKAISLGPPKLAGTKGLHQRVTKILQLRGLTRSCLEETGDRKGEGRKARNLAQLQDKVSR